MVLIHNKGVRTFSDIKKHLELEVERREVNRIVFFSAQAR
jgi:hypothetical protein